MPKPQQKANSDADPGPRFEEDARAVLDGVRDALAGVLEALPGRPYRASDVSRVLGVDRKLAWKCSKIVESADPFSRVEHIPGPAGLQILLEAAGRQGVPLATLQTARNAYEQFERLIEVHAGDRASLEMMAQAFSREASDQIEVTHRKSAFAGNSYIWGVQAGSQVSANIIAPSATPGKVDVALVSGLIDLRRLRPKVAWVVARTGFVSSEGKSHPSVAPPDAPARPGPLPSGYKIPLLADFCSSPLPDLRANLTDAGMVEIELVEGPVGDRGAFTCMFSGDPFRGVGSRYRTDLESKAHLNAHIRTPSTMLVHDLVVHRGLFGPLAPDAAAYSELQREIRSATTRQERYRLPMRLAVDALGRGPATMRTPYVPRYAQMIRHVCESLHWDADQFDVYRLQMAYPVVPSVVVISFDLPEPPG